MYETRARYSESLLREAVRFFVFRMLYRQLGLMFFVAIGLLVFILTWFLYQQDRSWFVGFLIAALVFSGVFMTSVYVAHYRNTLGRFRQMRVPEAIVRCDEDVICFTSELGSSTVPWSAITELWRHDRFWLLFLPPAQFVTLPLDCLDEPIREMIARKIDHTKAGQS